MAAALGRPLPLVIGRSLCLSILEPGRPMPKRHRSSYLSLAFKSAELAIAAPQVIAQAVANAKRLGKTKLR